MPYAAFGTINAPNSSCRAKDDLMMMPFHLRLITREDCSLIFGSGAVSIVSPQRCIYCISPTGCQLVVQVGRGYDNEIIISCRGV